MRILIIGEFSGLAKHLKNGLQQLNHDVTIVQNGDAWKKLASKDDIICCDRSLYIKGKRVPGSNRFLAIITNIKVERLLKKKCPRPDLIIVINYCFLQENITDAGISCGFLRKCIKRGSKLIMTECGDGSSQAYFQPEYYKLINRHTSIDEKRYQFLLLHSHAIIPSIYGYYEGLYRYANYFPFDTSKISKAIPLPITVKKEPPFVSCVGRKIVIFHGIIRPIAKGTPFIREAMDRLQAELPDRVECICLGGIPYNEYVKLFDKIDILVDQTYGNGWGMNAAIGAMNGKCVLTPCGSENGINMGIDFVPFVRITPDSEQIYQTLKELVLNPVKIDEIKKASRIFIERYCDSRNIAERYLNTVGLSSVC